MNKIVKYRGDVRNLRVYKLSQIISYITEQFVRRYLRQGSRTIDQMQQAARSCKQNIVEGSMAAPTSKEAEIKLTNVANASLGELEEDYIDYLNFNNLEIWEISHPRIEKLREYLKTQAFENDYKIICDRVNSEEMCNLMITLIRQTRYLLSKMIDSQEKRFIEEGGIREAMSQARISHRNKSS
ncbi:MAG: four helix bundle suffix domain-containing protein [Paramuribaculum sp.]|nr:four helix bundle suffix domain-containing protein [Paramuribaculum sp.]